MKNPIPPLLVIATALTTTTFAAVSVGPSGTGLLTFDTLPSVGDWSTLAVGTSAGNITTGSQLDAAVQLLNASAITTPLGSSSTMPPSQQNIARWNSAGLFLQTKPTGVDYTVLMVTLVNNSGTDLTSLGVSYDLNATFPAGTTIQEDIPGHQVYFSLTGVAGSWQAVPQLSGGDSGFKSASITPTGPWSQGSQAFVLWADDNAPPAANVTTGNIEGGYTIDNVQVIPQVIPEPSTLGLLAFGGAATLLRRRFLG